MLEGWVEGSVSKSKTAVTDPSPDSLVLRLWAGPRTRMRPLEDIAREILKYTIDDQT
jgi:hypothetical protein